MSETEALFVALRQSADEDVVGMLERMVRDAPDHALNKINALDLAAKEGIDEERVIAAPECGAARNLRDVVERDVPELCRGPRRQYEPENPGSGAIQLRLLRCGLRE